MTLYAGTLRQDTCNNAWILNPLSCEWVSDWECMTVSKRRVIGTCSLIFAYMYVQFVHVCEYNLPSGNLKLSLLEADYRPTTFVWSGNHQYFAFIRHNTEYNFCQCLHLIQVTEVCTLRFVIVTLCWTSNNEHLYWVSPESPHISETPTPLPVLIPYGYHWVRS